MQNIPDYCQKEILPMLDRLWTGSGRTTDPSRAFTILKIPPMHSQ